MKKLFLFIREGAISNYGIGTYIRNMLSTCPNHFFRTTVVIMHARQEEFAVKDDADYIYIPRLMDEQGQELDIAQKEKGEKYYAYAIQILKKYMNPEDEYIFHLNHTQDYLLASALKREWGNIKIVVTIHYFLWSLDIYGNTHYLSRIVAKEKEELTEKERSIIYASLLEQKLFEIADKLICTSDFSAQVLEEYYEIPKWKINLIPLGIEDKYSVPDKVGLRARYGIPLDEIMLLFVGRLSGSKGLHFLIKAYIDALQYAENIHLYIIGSGDFDRYLPLCFPAWRHITFCGKLPQSSLYDFYRMSDVGIIPSLIEQCGYVAIEMLMFGLPIIGTDITGLQGKIIDGQNGYTLTVNEEEGELNCSCKEFRDKILSLTQMPSRMPFSEQSRRMYLQKYTLPLQIQKMTDLYTPLWEKI